MTQMRPAAGADHFVAAHVEGTVVAGEHGIFRDRCPEARPACAAFEFGFRAEKWLPARRADILSLGVVVPIGVMEWNVRPRLTQDVVLRFRKNLAPLRIGVRHCEMHFRLRRRRQWGRRTRLQGEYRAQKKHDERNRPEGLYSFHMG